VHPDLPLYSTSLDAKVEPRAPHTANLKLRQIFLIQVRLGNVAASDGPAEELEEGSM
jgi:hypothetical protein